MDCPIHSRSMRLTARDWSVSTTPIELLPSALGSRSGRKQATTGIAPKATWEGPDFKDAETLLDDFFDEVERVLREREIRTTIVRMEDTRRSK